MCTLFKNSNDISTMAGYSKKLLAEKLGIKPGNKITFVNHPVGYEKTLGPLPKDVLIALIEENDFDFIQLFTKDSAELKSFFPILKHHIKSGGMIWISWPKEGSKVKTDINENIIRKIGLENGMVDVKVIAVDKIWSGLKFVFRLKDRI